VLSASGIKRLALAVTAVLAVGFLARAGLSLLISADSIKDEVTAQIRAITGLDPVLSGRANVSLFPTGSATFNDVSLATLSSGTPALAAEQLFVRLRFFSLLAGRIEIADVKLVRPTIAIAFAPDGRSNWASHIDTLAAAVRPGPVHAASLFSEIRISDGTVLLQDETYNIIETLTNVDFSLAWPSISRSFAATGRFVWHDEPVEAALSLNDFAAALAGESSGLKLRLAAAPLNLGFDGSISYRPTLKLQGILAADSESLRDALNWAAALPSPTGGFGRFALKARTDLVGGNLSLSALNIELDGNSGEGALSLLADGRGTLQGTLDSETLDLSPYLSAFRLVAGNDWDRRPLSLDDLGGIAFDLRVSAGAVKMGHIRLGRTAVTANLQNGDLSVIVGESQAFGGTVNGSLGLANTSMGAAAMAHLQFSDVDLDQSLGDLFGFHHVEGKGAFAMAFDGSGASVYALMQNLNGTARLTSDNGVIAGLDIEQLLRRLERNPLAGRGDLRNGKMPYDSLSMSLKVTQGTARLEELRVEAPAVRLSVAGSASMPSRDLDLRGTASLLASATRDGARDFELPFLVQGPWSEPLIWPDAQALIRRSGAAAPLLDAVRNRLMRDRPAEGQTGPAPRLAAPANSPLE
jgi:AsmA protein